MFSLHLLMLVMASARAQARKIPSRPPLIPKIIANDTGSRTDAGQRKSNSATTRSRKGILRLSATWELLKFGVAAIPCQDQSPSACGFCCSSTLVVQSNADKIKAY